MEAGFILLAVLMSVFGIIIGRYIERAKWGREVVCGTLNAVRYGSDTSTDLFLTLNVPIEDVVSRTHVLLDVNVISDNSHE